MKKTKKIVNYDKYVAKNKLKFLAKLSELWLKYTSRIGRSRPRSSMENQLLFKLDELRKKNMLKKGELQMLGPRLWKLKVFEA